MNCSVCENDISVQQNKSVKNVCAYIQSKTYKAAVDVILSKNGLVEASKLDKASLSDDKLYPNVFMKKK